MKKSLQCYIALGFLWLAGSYALSRYLSASLIMMSLSCLFALNILRGGRKLKAGIIKTAAADVLLFTVLAFFLKNSEFFHYYPELICLIVPYGLTASLLGIVFFTVMKERHHFIQNFMLLNASSLGIFLVIAILMPERILMYTVNPPIGGAILQALILADCMILFLPCLFFSAVQLITLSYHKELSLQKNRNLSGIMLK